MNKLFIAKTYLPVALALAAMASVGTAPAFAQSASAVGSTLPWHYDAGGERISGWLADAPSVRKFARAPSTNPSGYSAYALAPATILAPDYSATVPSGLGPADRFGAAAER
jgi:hypothetical protein